MVQFENNASSPEIIFTIIISLKALFKARPLRLDFIDADALTPNNFLHGRPNPQLHLDFDWLQKKPRFNAQEILNHFWNR